MPVLQKLPQVGRTVLRERCACPFLTPAVFSPPLTSNPQPYPPPPKHSLPEVSARASLAEVNQQGQNEGKREEA